MPTKKELKKKVIVTEAGCWELSSYRGYNVLTVDGESRSAHKVFYETFKGNVPKGKNLTNVCRHRWCANPEHWTPKTPSEATRLGIIARGATDTRTVLARWMDAEGLTTGDLAKIAGESHSAASTWRQSGYPNNEAEALIRKKYPGFPIRPSCEGTI